MKKQIRSYYHLFEMRRERNSTFISLFIFILGIYSVAVLSGLTYINVPSLPKKLEDLRVIILVLFCIIVSFFPVIIFDYRSRWLEAKKKVFEEPLK